MTLPSPLPVLGHLPAFLSDKLGFLTRCAASGRDVVRLQIGEPTLLLTTPPDIQHVLTGNPANYTKTRRLTGARGKALSGSGMQTAIGAEHLRQRRLLQPAFHPRSVEPFVRPMHERTDTRLNGWTNPTLNIVSEMESIALSIIIGAIFGPDFIDEGDHLAKAITVRRAYLEYYYASVFPLPDYLPAPIVFRYRRALKEIDSAIHRAISDPRPPSGSFTGLFSGLRYPEGAAMNRSQLRDELLTLMSTGYETIGDALAWTLYLLALHPEHEAKMVEEIQSVLGSDPPSPENIAELRFTRMVLEESLRLYPPTWIFIRMAAGDDTLPSGESVRAGDKIYLCQYIVHRMERYFPDPERFDPNRFAPAARAARPRFSYFPFGGGQRVCIGEQFALQEAAVVLATVLSRFRLELVPNQKIQLNAGITLRARKGILMRLGRR